MELCISCSTVFNQRDFRWQTTYTIPAIGHKLFEDMSQDIMTHGTSACLDTEGCLRRKSETKVKNPGVEYLLWRGQYFDVNFVYLWDGVNIKQQFPLQNPLPVLKPFGGGGSDPSHKIVKFEKLRLHDQSRVKIPTRLVDIHGTNTRNGANRTSSYGWESRSDKSFLEIDLGELKLVTHIGTTGRFPDLDTFPKKEHIGKKRKKIFNFANKRFASYVHILKDPDEALNWVTEYEVSYRHYATKKWVCIGNFNANTNATTEHINDLFAHFNHHGGVCTRYLRIRPVASNNRATICIAVYGLQQQVQMVQYTTMEPSRRFLPDETITVLPDGKKSGLAGVISALNSSLSAAATDGARMARRRTGSETELTETVVASEAEGDVVVSPPSVETVDYVVKHGNNNAKVLDGKCLMSWNDSYYKYYDCKAYNKRGKLKQSRARYAIKQGQEDYILEEFFHFYYTDESAATDDHYEQQPHDLQEQVGLELALQMSQQENWAPAAAGSAVDSDADAPSSDELQFFTEANFPPLVTPTTTLNPDTRADASTGGGGGDDDDNYVFISFDDVRGI